MYFPVCVYVVFQFLKKTFRIILLDFRPQLAIVYNGLSCQSKLKKLGEIQGICVCVHVYANTGVCGVQKRETAPLELELQTIVSCLM